MGFPSVAQDYFIADFSFDENIITHPETTFVLKACGEGLRHEGVCDGDLLLVDRALTAGQGDIAVFIKDGDLMLGQVGEPTRPNPPSRPRLSRPPLDDPDKEDPGRGTPHTVNSRSGNFGQAETEAVGGDVTVNSPRQGSVWGVLIGSYHPRRRPAGT